MIQPSQNDHDTIAERLKDLAKLEAILNEVGYQVALEHARRGDPMPVWRNNEVVWEVMEVEHLKRHHQ